MLYVQDDLINSVVLPHLCHVDSDGDVAVRKFAVEIILSLTQHCSPTCAADLIAIVEKVGSVKTLKKHKSYLFIFI